MDKEFFSGESEAVQLIEALEVQLRHLDRSTEELQAIVDAGLDEAGTPLPPSDIEVYANTIAENKHARVHKEARLAELRRLVHHAST